VLFTGVALIIQMIWLGMFLGRFATLSQEISFALTVISLLITIYILAKNENSAYKLSWLVIILSFPIFGGVLYLFFGNKTPSRKMSSKIEKVHREKSRNFKQSEAVMNELKKDSERVAGRCRYLYEKTGSPVWKNTETTYFPLGEDMFEDMLRELEQAKHFIFLEYFIIEDGIFWGSIVDVLKRKAKEGLDVRLMYDDIGCLMLLPKEYVEEMEEAGISCIAFNPFKPILSLAMNNRDHRKIMVIDGHTAYTGGVNLADEYINMLDRFGHWKDTAMKFTGDAALNFTEMFLEMWNAFRETDKDFTPFLGESWKGEEEFSEENWESSTAVGYVQPFGDTPLDDDPTSENLYMDILSQAVDYVYIYTPYLIIGDTMRHALCMAAARGVDVKIITPGIPDKNLVFRMTRSNYKELLKAGVEIYEYKLGFIHAKSYVSDDRDAVIGTINMDYRSLYLHFECGAYLYKTESVLEMKQDFLRTLKKSRKIELSVLRQGVIQEVFDAVLQIIAPLV
jgi:cardiolipin synthase